MIYRINWNEKKETFERIEKTKYATVQEAQEAAEYEETQRLDATRETPDRVYATISPAGCIDKIVQSEEENGHVSAELICFFIDGDGDVEAQLKAFFDANEEYREFEDEIRALLKTENLL